MANEGVIQPTSRKMKSGFKFGKVVVQPLFNLSVTSTVNYLDKLINTVRYLPPNVKAKILHLMSKRTDLITDENISFLATEWTNELDFTNSSVSDVGILSLPKLTYLYKLDLNDTATGTRDNITSEALIHMSMRCPNLRLAYFRRCINICDKGVIALAEGCPHLLELNLSGCIKVTDVSIKVVAEKCGKLTNLNLAYTSITDESAIELSKAGCASHLQEVQVSHCKQLTDVGVEALLMGGLNISYLEIQGCPLLTDQSLDALEMLRDKFDLKQFNFTIPF